MTPTRLTDTQLEHLYAVLNDSIETDLYRMNQLTQDTADAQAARTALLERVEMTGKLRALFEDADSVVIMVKGG